MTIQNGVSYLVLNILPLKQGENKISSSYICLSNPSLFASDTVNVTGVAAVTQAATTIPPIATGQDTQTTSTATSIAGDSTGGNSSQDNGDGNNGSSHSSSKHHRSGGGDSRAR